AELLPGTGEGAPVACGVHADVRLPSGVPSLEFRAPLRFKGSAGLYWTALGKSTDVALRSNAAHPSFQGNWLPERHASSAKGFEAEWEIPYLGRGFPQAWRDGTP